MLCIGQSPLILPYFFTARSFSLMGDLGTMMPRSTQSHSTGEAMTHQGWLKKQGSGFVKAWQLRWFVLRRLMLYYYKDENESKEQVSITSNPCRKLIKYSSERTTTSQDSYLLLANSQSELDTWVRVLPTGVFGRHLEETMANSSASGAAHVPELVVQCVDFIRCHGLEEEGLFRLPGQATLVRELQEQCDYGDLPRLDSSTDVHTVTSLLKLYLRELPEPLVPFHDYQTFLSCATLLEKDKEKGMKELTSLVTRLPSDSFFLLKYICSFLDEVQSHSSVNKMSAHNLATVFGPNILRPNAQDPVAIMEGATMVQHLMMILIIYHGELFQHSPVNTCSSASRQNGIIPGSRGSTVSWDIGEASNRDSTATATAEKLEEQRRFSESEKATLSPRERNLATRKCSSLHLSSSDKMGMEHPRGKLLAPSNQSKHKCITGGRELAVGMGSGVHRQSMYDNVPGCGKMLESPAESGTELQVSDEGPTTKVMDLVWLQKEMTKQKTEYELQIQG
uniref:Si:ch211-247j9.1 n=1 Tax=Eptatretus burgeri TaxID=7764 RepID=A0A8C4WU77_EPTBU